MESIQVTTNDVKTLAQYLRQIEFFKDMAANDLDEVLKHIRFYGFQEGEIIFRAGDPGDAFFVVFEGELSVRQKRVFPFPGKKLNNLTPGTSFGEMALLNRGPRSATIQAETPTKLFVLMGHDFDDMVENNLSFAKHIRKVCDRRRIVNRAA